MDIAYRWIDRDVAALRAGWEEGRRLFLDTEFMRERTYWPKLALVQINDGRENLLIDPVPLEDADGLGSLFRVGPLVMHGCSEDLETLRAWPGVAPLEVEDTQIGAALCGFDLQCGYQKIVELLVGVQLPKSATRSDWLRRPLSADQLDYAVQDVHFLPAVYENVVGRLEKLGRMPWWREECARLLRDAARETDPFELWRQVKGVAVLDGDGRRRARAVAAWRDGAARAADLPRSFVLKDAELLALCQAPSLDRNALGGLGLHPSFVRRHGETVLAVIADSASDPAPPPLPGPPDVETRNTLKRLRDTVASVAASLEVTPEVLARRRWLESLVRDPENIPEPLTGWRHDLVARPLLDAL